MNFKSKNNIKIVISGRLKNLPPKISKILKKTINKTKKNMAIKFDTVGCAALEGLAFTTWGRFFNGF